MPASANLSRFYFPTQGVVYSLLIHTGLFLGSFFVPLTPIPVGLLQPPVQAIAEEVLDLRDVIYIPILPEVDSGMNESADLPPPFRSPRESAARQIKQESEPVKEAAPISAASATEGLSYPGPQPILSDSPDATNLIQTVLQPELVNPAILVPPIPLPNFVEMAYTALPPMVEPPEPEIPAPDETEAPEQEPEPPLVPQSEAKTTAPPIPEAKNAPAPPVEIPKPLPLPKLELQLPPVAPPPAPPAPPVPREARRPEPPAKPAPQPKLEPEPKTPPPVPQAATVVKEASEQPKVETQAQAAEDLEKVSEPEVPPAPISATGQVNRLSLTPMPAPPEQKITIPEGEARGRFAISPEPNLAASGTEPGLKSGVPPSPVVGIGNSPTAPSGATPSASPPSVVTVGFGQKPTTAKSSDVSAGAAAPAPSSGAGSAPAPKSNRSPFSGITIVGGVAPPRSAANTSVVTPPQTVRPLQTAYGLTVISTENSGGGLPSFGVFSNQPIYTVYLDMRQTENDSSPSWTLEFAVISEPDQPVNAADQSRSLQGLVLPFPAFKERPALPAELVRQHLGKMVIVYGVVNIGGGIEQLSVKESPDARLDPLVLDALSRWKFRSAQLNGGSVSVKFLLGIPLWLP